MASKYLVDLRFVDDVVIGPADQESPLVMINFDRSGRIIEKKYALEDKATKALQLENAFGEVFGDSSAIVFYTGDREESKRLQLALNYIKEVCKISK